jgi:hypothetical protein
MLKSKNPSGGKTLKERNMSNVVAFPTEPKADNLVNQITGLQREIVGKFEKLTDHYIQSRVLEQECNDLQYRYDNLILQYAGVVGNENIPAGLLEHCARVIATYDNENDEIMLTFDEEAALAGSEQAKTEPEPENQHVAEIEAFMESITNFLRKQMDELQ